MTEDQIIRPKPKNPIDISPALVEAHAKGNKCSPQDAFASLLAKDLLERLHDAKTVDDLKVIVKVLVTSVVGDGSIVRR